MSFACLEDMVLAAAEAVRPAERITVSEAAERYHIVKNPGQHEGPFSLAKTPYLREPQDTLASLDYTGMIFAGPARTGKSAMLINWLAHTAITDPADMMVVHMAQHTARDWSQADLAKALRNSPELAKRLKPGRQNDNVFDKSFLSGMRLTVTWPTIKNLSGKTIPRLWVMDLDRIKPQIIDDEGHVYDLTSKRADTFKRYGMAAAEASPGFPVQDPKWQPKPDRPHEAPPCEGILSLYNRGDRRRWYWQCPSCGDTFQPRFNLLRWPDSADRLDAAEQAFMACPHCYEANRDPITFSMQPELNNAGRWLKEGQLWLPDGQIVGTARRSKIASFWMFGPAAGFTDWSTLVHRYLTACDEFESTASDGSLMTTVTVDQGEAYVPKAADSGLLPETLKGRAEDWGGRDEHDTPFVPAGARFLMATIDVQAGGRPSFVVHVYGFGPVTLSPRDPLDPSAGYNMSTDVWHVDMRKISLSRRRDEANDSWFLLDPAAYPEDWDTLIEQVIERTYPLPDDSGRRMGIKLTACDSGGKDGVTRNAYDFYRRLASRGMAKRFHLLKGAPSKSDTAALRMTLPDSQQKDKLAIARGDVPVWLINSNIVKDTAFNMLSRTEPGGMVHFPSWSPDWLYNQLTVEYRDPTKGWQKPQGNPRNEAWDLLAYAVAFTDHPDIRLRFIDWNAPPGWAAEWDRNTLVVGAAGTPETAPAPARTLADLARDLA